VKHKNGYELYINKKMIDSFARQMTNIIEVFDEIEIL